MELLLNYLPWIWLGVAILCLLIEGFTFSLTTVWFAVGAIVMIFLSLTHMPFQWQVLIFLVISLILLIFTRPFAVKKLHVKKTPTNSDALIGKKVIVTERITDLERGAVKLNGVVWTASSENGETIEKGTECSVVDIQGATAVVKPLAENKKENTNEGEEK